MACSCMVSGSHQTSPCDGNHMISLREAANCFCKQRWKQWPNKATPVYIIRTHCWSIFVGASDTATSIGVLTGAPNRNRFKKQDLLTGTLLRCINVNWISDHFPMHPRESLALTAMGTNSRPARGAAAQAPSDITLGRRQSRADSRPVSAQFPHNHTH